MNVVFFPKYTQKGPSSRYRIYQYLPYYKSKNICISVYPLLDDEYINCLYNTKSISKSKIIKFYWNRIRLVLKLQKSDLVYIEYEFLPYFPPILEWYISKIKGIKYIVDYDDAIFHNYDNHPNNIIRILLSNKIASVMKWSKHIITGSPYLTTYASKLNTNVTEIPTSIDFSLYDFGFENEIIETDVLKIGWVGSKTTSINIIKIIPALQKFASKYEMKLLLLGFDTSLLNQLNDIDCKLLTWTSETEIQNIKSFDIGIMPLDDTLFNRGKCGFKLIQYMACSLPTISSPLEANIKINRNYKNLHATTNQEWYIAFEKIYKSKQYYKEIGKENKLIVKEEYSIQSNVNKYISIFEKLHS